MAITKQDISEAHARIAPYIHRTHVLTSDSINEMYGCKFYFKCENFQKIGAFKIRGGMNASLQLASSILEKGLATHSSGNHAQAIALAAKLLGTRAYIVMPDNSPAVKVNAVKGYGAEITFCEPTLQAREDTMEKVIRRTGAEFIHPFNDERIVAGQATAAKELIEEVKDLEVIIAPVGGGGLLSGTSLSAKYFGNNIKVYAGEPEGAADAVLSYKSGKIESAPYIKTIADGLLTTLGDITLGIIRENVSEIFTVTEEEIIKAMRLVYERMKIVIEPSSAVPLAAIIKHADRFKGKRIGVIISGGNVDLSSFRDWF
ncbi:MAG: pyridoxal-phosphate dependent enzyme [Ignavibacteriae bacterium]|nr:pyridoxal-phosphate dependent enzyme [Ignavibacteriota bacterium]